MIKDVITFPVLGPFKGVAWIAGKILEKAQLEMPSERTVRRDLTELQLRMDLGEIEEDEFEKQEELLLQQLRELREAEAANLNEG